MISRCGRRSGSSSPLCHRCGFVIASYWSLGARPSKQVRESEIGGLGHACEMETSMMLHLYPDRVKMDLARPDGPGERDPYRKTDMQYARPVAVRQRI